MSTTILGTVPTTIRSNALARVGRVLLVLLGILGGSVWSGLANAQITPLLPFQGVLRTHSGTPISEATDVMFSLYDLPEGGPALWSETLELIPSNGVVSAVLGRSNPIEPTSVAGKDLYLGIRVAGESEMRPRTALGVSINAIFSGFSDDAAHLGGSPPDYYARSDHSHGGGGDHLHELGDLADVSILTPQPGDVLIFDGSDWVPGALQPKIEEGGVGSYELAEGVEFGSRTEPGWIKIEGENNTVAKMLEVPSGAGLIETFNKNGQSVVRAHSDHAGLIGVLEVDGFFEVRDPQSGDVRVQLDSFGNDGYITVYDIDSEPSAGIDGSTGELFGAITTNEIEDPDDNSGSWLYAALMGPEAAVYCRGQIDLEQGAATLDLPPDFSAIVDPLSVTVNLTPRSAESLGLAAVDVSHESIKIVELQSGEGSYLVDYVVQGARRDFVGLRSTQARTNRTPRPAEEPADPSR